MNTKTVIFSLIAAIAAIGILSAPISAFATKTVNVEVATTDSSAAGTVQIKIDKDTGSGCDFNPSLATTTKTFSNNFASHSFTNQNINNGDTVCAGAIVQDGVNNVRWGFEFTTLTAGSGGSVDFTGADKVLLTEHTP